MAGARAPGWLAATALVIGVASCAQIIGLQPFDGGAGGGGGSTNSTGGGGAASTGARTTGTGAGDAGGGSIGGSSASGGGGGGCTSGLDCFATAPSGWSQPFALVSGCGSWTRTTTYHAAPSGAKCDVTACSCSHACAVELETDADSADCSTVNGGMQLPTSCSVAVATVDSVRPIVIVGASSGACQASGNAQPPPLTDRAVCEPPSVVACGAKTCISPPPAGALVCISRTDDAACPAPFGVPHPELYANVPPDPCRCACVTPTATCTGHVDLFGLASCSGMPDFVAPTGQCTPTTPGFDIRKTRYVPDGSCQVADQPYPPTDVVVCCTT